MVVDLVEVLDSTDVLRRNVTLATEHLDRADDAHVLVLLDALSLPGLVVRAVEPLAHVNVAGAVADLVRYIGGRGGDVVDGADELDLESAGLLAWQNGDGLGNRMST